MSEWRVCGASDLPVKNGAWDKSAAEKSLGDDLTDQAVRKRWRDAHFLCSGDPSLKGSYHLPFATYEGDGLKAVSGGIQACAGGHGVDAVQHLPADIRDRVKKKIVAYYRKMGAEAPWDREKAKATSRHNVA